MSGFNDFVSQELPKRPFVETDGEAGQMLVRSPNPQAVREMVWADKPKVDTTAIPPLVAAAVSTEVGTVSFVAAYLLST